MEALILAGGLGTRLQAIVNDRPKPMALIRGQPFLEILLSSLCKKGFKRIIISVGFMADYIINYFGNSFLDMELIYSRENIPLGTGGAIKESLKKSLADHIYIFNGDTYIDLEVQALENLWQINNRPLMVGVRVINTLRYGRIESSEGIITSFVEKGLEGEGIINAGVYVVPRNILNGSTIKFPFSFEKDFLQKDIKRIPYGLFISKGYFIDIGDENDYLKIQNDFNILNNA
jgi:D-glycero-alpha-D-manno-heptose 1-phosphate guanylyltransferase